MARWAGGGQVDDKFFAERADGLERGPLLVFCVGVPGIDVEGAEEAGTGHPAFEDLAYEAKMEEFWKWKHPVEDFEQSVGRTGGFVLGY